MLNVQSAAKGNTRAMAAFSKEPNLVPSAEEAIFKLTPQR